MRPCDAYDAARARLVADEKVGRLESATCGAHRLLTAYIFVHAETLYFDERGALVGASAVSDAPVPGCGGEFSSTFGRVPECGNATGAREVVKP